MRTVFRDNVSEFEFYPLKMNQQFPPETFQTSFLKLIFLRENMQPDEEIFSGLYKLNTYLVWAWLEIFCPPVEMGFLDKLC